MRLLAALVTLLLAAFTVSAANLTHRVWLLDGAPEEAVLVELRAAGVDGLVVPIGEATVAASSVRFTSAPVHNARALAGWPVVALVWVEGQGKADGDAAGFIGQVSSVLRALPGSPGLLLAARSFWPGLPDFASDVARLATGPVELALPASVLAERLPADGWPRLPLVAVAFGTADVLGFPSSTLHDDLAAIDAIDERNLPYRAALVVRSRSDPAPDGPVSLAPLVRADVASYRPGERGDVFTLVRAIEWGGRQLRVGESVEARMIDTATYHRDLTALLRPARGQLAGWDTVGLPPPEPAIGMSREAFLDYLRGGLPYPVPDPLVEAIEANVYAVAVSNRTPHSSAIASTGNWVEVAFEGTEIREVQLGGFSGVQYGRKERGRWRDTIAREANAVRLLVTYVAARGRVDGGVVAFISRPRNLTVSWGVRTGDGRDVVAAGRQVRTP